MSYPSHFPVDKFIEVAPIATIVLLVAWVGYLAAYVPLTKFINHIKKQKIRENNELKNKNRPKV